MESGNFSTCIPSGNSIENVGVGGGYNRMNISYQREMKRNYLIVETEKRDEIPFEQNMLEQNQIDGVLHFQVRKKDTDIRFFYEITSKQPLFRLLEGQSVQAGQIRTLVRGIAYALEHMEQYLLSENCVLLTPEYLYVEPESLKVWLCLVPGLERDFPEDYSRLLEYLLARWITRIKNRLCWLMDYIRKPEKKIMEWKIFSGLRSRNWILTTRTVKGMQSRFRILKYVRARRTGEIPEWLKTGRSQNSGRPAGISMQTVQRQNGNREWCVRGRSRQIP